MSAWIVFLIIAVIFFIIEIYTPTMFFLNFSLAAAICSALATATENYNILIPIFVALSVVFLLFLRPLFNLNPKKSAESSLDSQYIGKQAVAITNISPFSGRITIYDEDWEARLADERATEIQKGEKVKILRHDDLTMYVEKMTTKGKK